MKPMVALRNYVNEIVPYDVEWNDFAGRNKQFEYLGLANNEAEARDLAALAGIADYDFLEESDSWIEYPRGALRS